MITITIASVFPIFLRAALRLSRKLRVASLVYVKTTYTIAIYGRPME